LTINSLHAASPKGARYATVHPINDRAASDPALRSLVPSIMVPISKPEPSRVWSALNYKMQKE